MKVHASVTNARAFLEIQREFGSFDSYIWGFVDGKPLINRWSDISQLPARSDESDRLSNDLKKRGFKFIGTTICYALMQAVGMINDHTTDCFRYEEIKKMG